MNHPARVFRDLTSAWHQDAASERVDCLAAELAAAAANTKASLLLGLIEAEAVAKFYGLVFLLDSYGLILRKRYRQAGDGVYVYLDKRTLSQASEFAGAVVHEHVSVPRPALPQAA